MRPQHPPAGDPTGTGPDREPHGSAGDPTAGRDDREPTRPGAGTVEPPGGATGGGPWGRFGVVVRAWAAHPATWALIGAVWVVLWAGVWHTRTPRWSLGWAYGDGGGHLQVLWWVTRRGFDHWSDWSFTGWAPLAGYFPGVFQIGWWGSLLVGAGFMSWLWWAVAAVGLVPVSVAAARRWGWTRPWLAGLVAPAVLAHPHCWRCGASLMSSSIGEVAYMWAVLWGVLAGSVWHARIRDRRSPWVAAVAVGLTPYLHLIGAVTAAGLVTGSALWYLGRGDRHQRIRVVASALVIGAVTAPMVLSRVAESAIMVPSVHHSLTELSGSFSPPGLVPLVVGALGGLVVLAVLGAPPERWFPAAVLVAGTAGLFWALPVVVGDGSFLFNGRLLPVLWVGCGLGLGAAADGILDRTARARRVVRVGGRILVVGVVAVTLVRSGAVGPWGVTVPGVDPRGAARASWAGTSTGDLAVLDGVLSGLDCGRYGTPGAGLVPVGPHRPAYGPLLASVTTDGCHRPVDGLYFEAFADAVHRNLIRRGLEAVSRVVMEGSLDSQRSNVDADLARLGLLADHFGVPHLVVPTPVVGDPDARGMLARHGLRVLADNGTLAVLGAPGGDRLAAPLPSGTRSDDKPGLATLAELFTTRRIPAPLPAGVSLPGGVPGTVGDPVGVGTDRMEVPVSGTRAPVLVKVSWHPRWKVVEGGRGPWLAGAGMMVVVPDPGATRVVLEWSPPAAQRAAALMGLVGFPLVIAAPAVTAAVRRAGGRRRRSPGVSG